MPLTDKVDLKTKEAILRGLLKTDMIFYTYIFLRKSESYQKPEGKRGNLLQQLLSYAR